ncbi:hypothetical protein FRACYDRAFT_247174 [Fragilariopsis cylindrus CCMP1102]|uniref:Uncharacterized protein n=1 Tax=Fragilariopsis cylindrus CCMP1102 TaxID=635003 RepID=A0A1E7EXJ7_9STRA|nr:hypothetical protein FRACYDRAFT_247174 [Fragilariopsis cylindrus CCMP1102]|eukprot:OEU10632.1 hypothetical protein FRACYDRAFT_247174 [Fragilariopsis cylindrus CCMP1102]
MSKLLLLQLQLLLLLLVDTDNVAKAFAFGTVTNDCSGSGSRRQTFLTASGANKSCYDLTLRQRKIKLSGNGSSKLLGSQSSLPETFIATSITTTTKLDDSELKPRRRQIIKTGRRMGGRHQKLTSQKKKTVYRPPAPLHQYLWVYYLYCLFDVNLSVWFALCGIITITWYWSNDIYTDYWFNDKTDFMVNLIIYIFLIIVTTTRI